MYADNDVLCLAYILHTKKKKNNLDIHGPKWAETLKMYLVGTSFKP